MCRSHGNKAGSRASKSGYKPYSTFQISEMWVNDALTVGHSAVACGFEILGPLGRWAKMISYHRYRASEDSRSSNDVEKSGARAGRG